MRVEKCNVTIVVEVSVIDRMPSAKRCKDFLIQAGSKRVKVSIDPVNLIPNSSEEDMFKYLKDDVFYIHGKDRMVNSLRGRVVDDGEVN